MITLRGLLASVFVTTEVFIPLLLVREQGWSLTQAGLVLSAGAVLWSCGSAVQARIGSAKNRWRALSNALRSSAALAVAGVLFSLAGERGPHGYVLVWALAALLAVVGALLGRRLLRSRGIHDPAGLHGPTDGTLQRCPSASPPPPAGQLCAAASPP